MTWENQLTTTLKINYPIVQAPMLGVTTPLMVAEVSNNGGLGSLPVGGLSPEKTADLIEETKGLTNKPFAVNLFINEPGNIDIQQVAAMQNFLEDLCRENSIPYKKEPVETFKHYSYREQIKILLDANIPIVSFTFGILNDESIKALKEKGAVLIGTATSVKEARLLDGRGIDIIAAQGIEAGGHRGSFITGEPLAQVGSMSLIPQVVKNINRPILAAGGINDGNTIKAAFLLGAKGVQIGTAFIASDESIAIPTYKTALQNASETGSVLTRAFSGRWARGIMNKFIMELEKSGLAIPGYPVQLHLTSSIRSYAVQQDNKEFTSLWAGQSCNSCEARPVAYILKKLIQQAEAIM